MSQQVASTVYVSVYLQPLGVHVVWLKKTDCQADVHSHGIIIYNIYNIIYIFNTYYVYKTK